eukprot:5615183-Pleurochrysis_carterae.AAC.1
MSRRVSALSTYVRRRGRLGRFRLARLLCDTKSVALRLVKLYVTANLARFKIAQNFSDGIERESSVARGALHHKLYVQYGVDALTDASYDGAQLLGDQCVTQLGVRRERSIEARECVVQAVEFSERSFRETLEKQCIHHKFDGESRRGRRCIGLGDEDTDECSSAVLVLYAIAGTRSKQSDCA